MFRSLVLPPKSGFTRRMQERSKTSFPLYGCWNREYVLISAAGQFSDLSDGRHQTERLLERGKHQRFAQCAEFFRREKKP
jgi:hypothetical protein